MEIALILMIPIGLWMLSLYWLSKWAKFWTFFLINLVLVFLYMTWLTQSELKFLGHDEYGLGRLFLIVEVLIGHIIAGFIFVIFKRRQLK